MIASRKTLWWARIVCLSAFGPYVTGSARTEQVAVFASALFVLVAGWSRMLRARFSPAPFLLAWGALCAVMAVSTVYRPADPMFYGSQPPSHALSAMLMPLALMVVTWYWTLSADPVSLIRAVAPLVTAGMCVNTVIELAQLSAGKAAVFGVLPRFWDAAPSVGSVAANAAEDGRYTGIFNQPAEAGIAYGVALLCLVWLGRRAWKPLPVTLAGVLLVAGGVLTLSKVFLLCALPVAILTVLRGPARVRVVVTAGTVAAGFWLAGTAGALPAWRLGGMALGRLASPQMSLTAQYTAGRYGSGGTLGPEYSDVLHNAAWAGFGAGGLDGPAYDSLWQQALVVSGVLGVVLTAAVFVMLAYRWTRLRGTFQRPEWHLAGGVLALAAGASLGIPSLTANRACTLLWLVLGLLVAARSPGRASPSTPP